MKQLTIFNPSGHDYGYMSIVRTQDYNMGDYNQLYVYMNDEVQAQALAFCPLAEACLGVWTHPSADKDYKYIIRLVFPKDVHMLVADEDE